VIGRRYGRSLRAAVGSSAAPYGFTLAVWTTGAVIIDSQGLPSAINALSFAAGSVLAFAFIGFMAFGDFTGDNGEKRPKTSLWGNFHFLSVGLAIGAAVLVTSLVHTDLVWLLATFASTACYLLALGAEFTAAEGRSYGDGEH
jgi:hypothetical protein